MKREGGEVERGEGGVKKEKRGKKEKGVVGKRRSLRRRRRGTEGRGGV